MHPDFADPFTRPPMPAILARHPALLALIGPAAAGKTSLAARFPNAWVLCLDTYRRWVAGDPGDQAATDDAVRVQQAILTARLSRRLPCVLDATHTEPRVREQLLATAAAHRMPAYAVLVTTPLAECLARNARRMGSRRVPDEVVRRQHAATPTPADLSAEGWHAY